MLFNKLLLKPTNNISIQVFRYTIAGAIAFGIDFLTLFSLTELWKVYYMISATISFILGLFTSYILNIKWVFVNRKFKNRLVEISIFSFIGIIGVLLNLASIWIFTEYIGLYYLVSKVIATVFVFSWNFTAKKIFLF